jgi:hypothetical protein
MNRLWPCVVRELLQSDSFGSWTVSSQIVGWVPGRRTGVAVRPSNKFVNDADRDVDKKLRVSLEQSDLSFSMSEFWRYLLKVKDRTSPSTTIAGINHHRLWSVPKSFSWLRGRIKNYGPNMTVCCASHRLSKRQRNTYSGLLYSLNLDRCKKIVLKVIEVVY